jgi:hypothetical protein
VMDQRRPDAGKRAAPPRVQASGGVDEGQRMARGGPASGRRPTPSRSRWRQADRTKLGGDASGSGRRRAASVEGGGGAEGSGGVESGGTCEVSSE